MKQSQILVLLILLVGNGMHAAASKEEHWLEYNNPFDNQFDGQLWFHGDSFQQSINQKNEDGYTFLIRAILKEEQVKRLIELGADVNEQCENGSTPLHWVARLYSEKAIPLLLVLLDASADINRQGRIGTAPLHVAAKYNRYEIVQLLLANGADINQRSNGGFTPLHWAVFNNSKEVTQLLLAGGANAEIANNDGCTAKMFITNNLMGAIFDEALSLRNK